jgi:hypothetical protein
MPDVALPTPSDVMIKQRETHGGIQNRERPPVVVINEGGEKLGIWRGHETEPQAAGVGQFLKSAENGQGNRVAGEDKKHRAHQAATVQDQNQVEAGQHNDVELPELMERKGRSR